ncbi:MAG: hypothetical protein KKC75_02720 [Nanoarchaeota archaeon]|nr:hypothetical protein [Nanoarchaeota archaeon]MBU1005497.1 hypothetical protein [Nanoarchaeota archaeon]MBU1945711.1 hypothetical protein [Nanoarchaeota archaeon]
MDAIRRYQEFSLSAVLEVLPPDVTELTFAVHSAIGLKDSKLTEPAKLAYVESTRNYLGHCRGNDIKIVHLRDMLDISEHTPELIVSNREPTLADRFGINADYVVATFPNMGVPLELLNLYFEQMMNYGIFCPNLSNPNRNIRTINGIGVFTETNACFIDGLSVMMALSQKVVRIIKNCTLSRQPEMITLDHYVSRYGIDKDRVLLNMYENGTLTPSPNGIISCSI